MIFIKFIIKKYHYKILKITNKFENYTFLFIKIMVKLILSSDID